jgi:hypothetical protein
MNNARNELRTEILNTFAKSSPPGVDDLALDMSPDSMNLRSELGGIPWWEVTDTAIGRNYDNLPLLTPNAYHYYLPAFILSSLRNFESVNLVLVHTVFSLAPFKTSVDDLRFKTRRELFTAQEVEVVVMFLQCIVDDESMYSLYNDAERGMRKFWRTI